MEKIDRKTKTIVVIVISTLIACGAFASIFTFILYCALAPKDPILPWFILSISITALLVIGEFIFLLTRWHTQKGITIFLMSLGFSTGLVLAFVGAFSLVRGPTDDFAAWMMLIIGIIFLCLGIASTVFFVKFTGTGKEPVNP